ncbi:MAG TPA: Uma2 family endonuclease [Oscillatoriales cyanobacterium M59_W2019_021]|nr:MAG: Uma2 family endonuclease [Cyanobacteria bacterium J055]HIK32160.1 Uma2 family endonuclease [Oscillatoriales cyanobacterium M4454_W2019_049]HIK51743.1 Uma2 family endonuclease [Oscillatoriales cyanobacterium M59_W2019_021]
MSLMTVKDLEELQATFKALGRDYQLELEDGKIIVMGPSDMISSEVGSLLIRLLGNWVYPRRLGRVFDSAGGFILPDTNLKAPDVSFVRADRLKRSVRYFGEMVPDLVVEIKSQSDRISPLQKKLLKFIELGAIVGLLVDPDRETVAVYRSTGEPIKLGNGDILTLPELLPGWELSISELWPPVYEDEA